MKKMLAVLFVMMFVLSATVSFADDCDGPYGPGTPSDEAPGAGPHGPGDCY